MDETLATAATEIIETVPEVLETVAETVAETVPEVWDAVTEAGSEIYETVAEATVSFAEELTPIYNALTAQNNLLIVCICALGLCAGVLLGVALWRWLK